VPAVAAGTRGSAYDHSWQELMAFTITHSEPDDRDRNAALCDVIVTFVRELRLTRLMLQSSFELLIERDRRCRDLLDRSKWVLHETAVLRRWLREQRRRREAGE
jgi:hypothetical protein